MLQNQLNHFFFLKRIIKKFKGKANSYFAIKQTTHLFPLTVIVTSVVFTTPLVVSVNTISSSQKERNFFNGKYLTMYFYSLQFKFLTKIDIPFKNKRK